MLNTHRQHLAAISCQFLPTSLLGVSAATRAEISVDKSAIIRTQMGSAIDQKKVAVAWDALYDTTQ
jgi:hypothetical protein